MEQTNYKDLVEYVDMAKKTINAFSNRICPGICSQMSNSEDAIGEIAYAMMCADWKYDSTRKGKISRQSKTRYSYRNQCAIWAIQSYIKKYLKNKSVSLNSLVDCNEEMQLLDVITDTKQLEPVDKVVAEEETRGQSALVNKILNSKNLSNTQKDKLRMYFIDGLSLAKIGLKYGITREAVRQNIKTSIKKIKGEYV